jgi:branched-chain amino acid aminotransferase
LTLYDVAAEGIRLATVSVRRPDFDMLDPRVKSLNYLNNVMAKMEAKRQGADEALVLNSRGTIAEASAANVFAVLDGVVVTPPASDGALGGITRRRVLRLLDEANVSTSQASLTRFDLLAASEVFLTGTGAGIVPVGYLDGQCLGRERSITQLLTERSSAYCVTRGTPVPGLSLQPTELSGVA